MNVRISLFLLPTFASVLWATPVLAQSTDSTAVDTGVVPLPPVTVEAARSTETTATAPFAVATLRRSNTEAALTPALSLDAVLEPLPGVWITGRGHFALGERISVRGLGWRAPFGVRGVQVLLDGLPLTLPDGQALLDVVDPATIRQAELLRSPASLFWGNGSGGVLFLSTPQPTADPSFRLRGLAGSYGERQLLVEGGGAPLRSLRTYGYASHVRQDGYRNYSSGRRTRAGFRAAYDVTPQTRLHASFAGALQDTEHPGSLTRDQLEANRRMARPGFLQNGAGKESLQTQAGLTLDHETPWGFLSAAAYGLTRRLDNPLPFAYIDLRRQGGGGRLTFRRRTGRLQGGAGLDVGFQHDDRQNFNTIQGEPGDELMLSQIEVVTNLAGFSYLRGRLTERLALTAGLRYSRVHFALDDRLPADGDQSGNRTLTAWSPAAGLSYRLGRVLFFTSYHTSFETPTTTELVNRPDGTAGFNTDLGPQRTRGVEAGTRGQLSALNLSFDAALFYQRIDDALVQTGTSPEGREFFGNADGNTHRGVETLVRWRAHPGLELTMSYTGSQFTYDSDLVRSGDTLATEGNRVPGIPVHRLHAGARASHANVWGQLQVEMVSDFYANDENTAESDGYTAVDLRLGHKHLSIGPVTIQPFLAVQNLLDARYNGSVIVNAFGGRYYEPAAGRTFTAGLNLRL